MKINKVEIQAFRAYKTKENGTFDFTSEDNKPANFVAIYAPNGFGKSSFYDAVEWAITNNIERISGEYNRKIIDSAARSTKQQGIGQKILRNKDIDNSIPTFVNVSTTQTQYLRELGIPRSDSRDLPVKRKPIENQYFSKVVLSQDAIDRFLKEIKPQDRYSHFMDYFGGDLETSRQRLNVLINENNNILTDLKKNDKELKQSLGKPVDNSIVEKFNSLVKDLSDLGEKINQISKNDFSLNKEYEFNSHILTRKSEINFEINKLKESKQKISGLELLLPSIKKNKDYIEENQLRLKKINEGYLDSIKYEDKNSLYMKIQEDINLTIKKLADVQRVISFTPLYFDKNNLLKKIEEKVNNKKSLKLNYLKEIQDKESLVDNIYKDILENNERKNILKSKIDNSNQIYQDIEIFNNNIIEKNNVLSKNITNIELYNSICNDKKDKIEKLRELEISLDTLLMKDISQLSFSSDKINELKNFYNEISQLELSERLILNTQDALNKQMDFQEKLVSLGLSIVSMNDSDICPLCHVSHTSSEDLRNEILNNNLVSSVIERNLENLNSITERKGVLNEQIKLIINEALERKNNLIFDFQKEVNDLGVNISNIVTENFIIEAELNNINNNKNKLQSSIWNLTKKDLLDRSQFETENLNKINSEGIKNIEIFRSSISQANNEVIKISENLRILNEEVQSVYNDLKYKEVLDFTKAENIIDNNLDSYCEQLVLSLEDNLNNNERRKNEILHELNDLYLKMYNDGTWIEFSELKIERDRIFNNIADSEHQVRSFNAKINEIVPFNNGSYDSIDNMIKDYLLSLDARNNFLIKLLNKYDLLNEHLKSFEDYAKRLTLQKKLMDNKVEIDKHEKLYKILKKQCDLIHSKIKQKVDSFFFTNLINSIYKKIDPHPEFKKVEFVLDINSMEKPGLNIILKNDKDQPSSPILYFSAAQMNILSLSVFLANALHVTDDNGNSVDVIMIDDPIQSMDSINILSTIDLLRSIIIRFDKQIIISTHDKNFFELLRRKIPQDIMGSKFIELQKFGVAVSSEKLLEP